MAKGSIYGVIRRCGVRPGYRGLVDFDDFIRKKSGRTGSNTTHGG